MFIVLPEAEPHSWKLVKGRDPATTWYGLVQPRRTWSRRARPLHARIMSSRAVDSIAEELADAKFLPKEAVLIIIEKLVMKFLNSLQIGEDPVLTLVLALYLNDSLS